MIPKNLDIQNFCDQKQDYVLCKKCGVNIISSNYTSHFARCPGKNKGEVFYIFSALDKKLKCFKC